MIILNTMKKLYLLSALLFSVIFLFAESPKREFRATWFTTHYAIDWPKSRVTTTGNASQIATQKKEMTDILDQLKAGNLNAFCLQVRPTSDAYYASSYEPWGQYLTGTRGKDPGYDPLLFAVEEGHKRGMEVHAWVNPFRYEVNAGSFGTNDPLRKEHPDWLLTYDNGTFSGTIIDPGIPEARAYVVKVLMEIVTKYDIDGILMDDYFYAYGGTTTEDAASQAKYKPSTQSLADWRRENVNTVIHTLYDEIQNVKPWVKLGMGPGGIYSMDSSAAAKYGLTLPSGIRGGDPYTSLYCDPLAWVNGGYLDYLAPQVYWATTTTTTDYDVLCKWWGESVKTLCDRRTDGKRTHLYISQASYRFGADELGLEIDDNRKYAPYDAPGSIFYNTNTYLKFDGELTCQNLAKTKFAKPALIPAVTWKTTTMPAAVADLKLTSTTVSWTHSTAERFSVYMFPKGTNHTLALGSGDYLLGMVYAKSMTITGATNLNDMTIAVCAMDRYGNESSATYLNDAAELPVYTIIVKSEDESKGSVTGGGEYMQGAVASLVAKPKFGYEFTHWQDNNTDNPRSVTVTQNATYTASFSALSDTMTLQDGTLSRELLWQKTLVDSRFMKEGVAHRSIAYYDGKLYVSNGADYEYYVLNAADAALQKTVNLKETYFVWYNLRITDDGVMLFGNSATNASNISIYKTTPGTGDPVSIASYSNPEFGRTDYFYPLGSFGNQGIMLSLSNVNHKLLYMPYSNSQMGEQSVVINSDLPVGISAKAMPIDANRFIASVAGEPATVHSIATGELLESWSGSVKPKSVRVSGAGWFVLGGHKYILTPADIYGGFETYDVTEGLADAVRIYDATPALGSNDNQTYTIDFAVNVTGNDAYVYLLAPNNGIAAYKYTFIPAGTGVQQLEEDNMTISVVSDGIDISFSGKKHVDVYSLAGQPILSIDAENACHATLPKGAYIVKTNNIVKKVII